MSQVISPIQHFKVRRQAQLSYLQIQSLTQLYQPVLGSMAISVYITLSSLPMENPLWSYDMMHSQLLETLNMGISTLSKEKRKLEAIGLVKTYRQVDSHAEAQQQSLVYDLQMPYDAHHFFKIPQLSTALYKAIGDQNFQMKVKLFQIQNLANDTYKDVTTSFESVFNHLLQTDDDLPDWDNEDTFLPQQLGYGHIDVNSNDFDYAEFRSHLIAQGIHHTDFTQSLKEYVLTCHQLFGLNEVEMVEVVNLSRHANTKHIQLDRLQQIAKQRQYSAMQEISSNRQVDLYSKDQTISDEDLTPQNIQEKFPKLSNQEIQLAILFQKLSPHHFIHSIKNQHGGFVTGSETFILKELLQKSSLRPSVINALIYYILVISKKENIYKSMLENMANRWQQAEINDVYAALQWMKNEHISQQKHKNHQQNSHFSNKSSKGSRHVEQMPEWMKNPVTDRNFQANTSKTSDSDMESENRLKDRLNNLIKKEES